MRVRPWSGRPVRVIAVLVTSALWIIPSGLTVASAEDDPTPHEVWVLDQSGSGGTLYVYDGAELGDEAQNAQPEVIDLEGAARSMCEAVNGSTPIRAHMNTFSPDQRFAIVSYVGSGHVLFMDAATRTPVKCFDVGAQAHATLPSPDGTFAIVANQGGKKLHRFDTDADGDGIPFEDAADIVLEDAATLDLATCTTPNGVPCEDPVLRPSNNPVCAVTLSDNRLVFVTLAGGGLFVVDATTTPISIVAEYDDDHVKRNGCGGLEQAGRVYINSNGGSPPNPTGHHLYSFPIAGLPAAETFNAPNVPAPTLIFARTGNNDGHGADFNEAMQGRYLWANDRMANQVEVVDTQTDTWVSSFSLESRHSSDPAPDGLFVAPGGKHAYISMRGPCPLTANVASVDNAVGATPGLGVIAIQQAGFTGKLVAVAPISKPSVPFQCGSRGGAPFLTERADPHGIVIRLL